MTPPVPNYNYIDEYLDKSYNMGIQHAIDLIDSAIDNPAVPELTSIQILTVLRYALIRMRNDRD